MVLSVKPWVLCFIQTLPHTLCAVTISPVSFLDLFVPTAGANNLISNHFSGKLFLSKNKPNESKGLNILVTERTPLLEWMMLPK